MNNYYFPFEGDKHLATIVLLPYREDTWRNKALPALKEFLEVCKAISQFEKVYVIYSKHVDKDFLQNFKLPNIELINIEYDDSWARDNTPIFLASKEKLLGLDFGFNSWGGTYNGLYSSWEEDNKLSERILKFLNISREAHKDFILEGGSIHSNGKGVLLTTSCCLLSKGRNPKLNKEQIEEYLKKALRVKKILFVPNGIYNDETSGHVDNICCFLDSKTILLATCSDKNDPQYKLSLEDEEFLTKQTDLDGKPFRIIKVPVPKTMYLTEEEANEITNNNTAVKREGGRRLAGSYVNFYMGEKFIILPKFNCKEDEIAKKILEDFYQGSKKIIQIYSKEILLGGGNIHCITKQIPIESEEK